MKVLKGIVGTAKYDYIGLNLQVRATTDGATQIWYSSRKSNKMHLNSLVVFQDYETEVYDFQDDKEKFTFTGESEADFVSFSCHNFWCFYKSNLNSEIGTFASCDYNQKLVIGENDYPTLDFRKCSKCEFANPFSYGFA